MHLRADVMGYQAHNALAVSGGQHLLRLGQTVGETIYPDTAIRVQHDFDDSGVVQEPAYGDPERCAQHARTARAAFRIVVWNHASVPVSVGNSSGRSRSGMIKRTRNLAGSTSFHCRRTVACKYRRAAAPPLPSSGSRTLARSNLSRRNGRGNRLSHLDHRLSRRLIGQALCGAPCWCSLLPIAQYPNFCAA